MIKNARTDWATVVTGVIALQGMVSCSDAIDDSASTQHSVQPATGPGGRTKSPPHTDDTMLVRFKSGTTRSRSASVHAKHSAQIVREYRVPPNLQLVALKQGTTVEQMIEDYRRDPEVLYAEPNFIYQPDVVPNDPGFGDLWGMHNTGQLGGVIDADINAPEAWQITTGSSAVVIGLLDTGVDYNHPDLAANMFTNPGEIAGNGIDDDGDGWVDDVHGINTLLETGDPMDDLGHGTHVSGTIAANGNNALGVTGVNWNATIVACKAFGPFGGQLSDILQCMDYFLTLKTRPNNPVDIVATNNSWGGGPFSQALLDAIDLHRQAGMLFVAAAGNDGVNTDVSPHYPSSYALDNIISVLATNRFDQRASFSNFGPVSVDVGAPGEDVLSTLPGNSYGLLSGTSMATPHVTGLVGLLKAQNPMRNAHQIKNLILTGGTPSAGATGTTLSGRRIRADRSLNCVNQRLENRFAPAASPVLVSIGTPLPLGMLSITCDVPSAGPLLVTVVETGETIALVDSDGSGRFQGSFTATAPGTSTLAFPNGDLITVTAARNYDPARVVAFEFTPITGTQLPLNCDFCVATIESPFPIHFAGTAPGMTTLFVISKGVLSFNAPGFFGFENLPLPSPAMNTIVAPFWDDLFPEAGGSVQFAVVGQAPSRQLVVEYDNVPHWPGFGAVTFQIVFFEDSPNIRFNYADVQFGDPSFDNGASQTVGVQIMPSIAQQFSFNTPSLSNNLSLLWTTGAPIAVAGADQIVLPLAQVTLDGSNSQDPDGAVASYLWTQTAGTPVVLNDANTATPSFTAPAVPGTLTFRLEVTDTDSLTATDSVDVLVDAPPIAVANEDFRVGTNLQGTLDATASFDPDGTIVGYHWTQLHGDPVTILNADTPVATFTTPATAQFLVFQLTVVDEHGFTGDAVVVADVFLNLLPVADAGQNRIVRPGASVTLDASGSHDPDGTIVSYAWTELTCFTVDGPCTVTLQGADLPAPRFEAPSSPGVIVLHLTVTDTAGAVATDVITIGVFIQPPNAAITAATSCVRSGSTVQLDGSRSMDPDGDIVTYEWTQLAGPPVALVGATAAVASFMAPGQGTLVFALRVIDRDGLVGTAQITIPIDPPPIARATTSATVALAGTTVILDGSQSIDVASLFWRQTAGTTQLLSNASAASPSFVATNPLTPFEFETFELTVTDSCGARSTDSVTVIVVKN